MPFHKSAKFVLLTAQLGPRCVIFMWVWVVCMCVCNERRKKKQTREKILKIKKK